MNSDEDSSDSKTSDDEKKEDLKEKILPEFSYAYASAVKQSHLQAENISHLPTPYFSLPEIPPELV